MSKKLLSDGGMGALDLSEYLNWMLAWAAYGTEEELRAIGSGASKDRPTREIFRDNYRALRELRRKELR